MNLQAKGDKNFPLGFYLHVPFCASTCDFCAFYQEKPLRKDILYYLDGVKEELAQVIEKNLKIETFFWGGGTPGLLSAKDLEKLGTLVLSFLENKPKEWTVEMAPSTIKADKLKLLKSLGVNRISMGVQSFNPSLLKSLGRLHAPQQVYKAYELIRKAGFENVNLDLIFAIPGQSMQDWETDLTTAINLAPEHISTYCLTFEEDTALYVKLAKGKVKRSEENEIHMYQKSWEILETHGYFQYEISNFARFGFPCEHNLNTWRMFDWVGIGPSASSQYKNKRYTNPHSLELWLKGLKCGKQSYVDEVLLDETTLFLDALVFGLRMNEGVVVKALKKRFAPTKNLENVEKLLTDLVLAGLCEEKTGTLSLTASGRLLADKIGAQIYATL